MKMVINKNVQISDMQKLECNKNVAISDIERLFTEYVGYTTERAWEDYRLTNKMSTLFKT